MYSIIDPLYQKHLPKYQSTSFIYELERKLTFQVHIYSRQLFLLMKAVQRFSTAKGKSNNNTGTQQASCKGGKHSPFLIKNVL